MALKFLPVQTPSTVGILVFTRDKYLQSEIEISLHEYQHIFFASNTNEASNILADGQIGIVIIDTNILESDDSDLVLEMLSFFSELIVVSFLEAGSTHNLVALSEKYDVYRYLKIPCAHKKIANCVRSAVKKYLKQYVNKDIEDKKSLSLPSFLRNRNIAAIAVVIVPLILLLTMIDPSTENNEQEHVLTQNQQLDTNNINNIIHKNSDVTIPTEPTSILEQILLNAHDKYKTEHYYDPEQDSALFFYVKALNLDPNNQEALTGLRMVLNLMVDNINVSLKINQYHQAVKVSNIMVKTLPNSSLNEPILRHLSEQGMILIAQAKKLADNGELDAANASLANAVILLGLNHEEISAAESYISSATNQSSQITELLKKVKLRLSSDNLTKPTNDSAKFYLLSLKEMAPEHHKISPLLLELADKLLGYTNTAIDENNISKAKYFLQEAKALNVRTESISKLETIINSRNDTESVTAPISTPEQQSDIIQNRIEIQEKINELLILARKSYNSEQYFSPENNNASHFLLLAKKIDSHNEDINYSINELADKTLSIIQIKLADEQMTEANTLINHVKQLGVRTEEIGKLEQEIN